MNPWGARQPLAKFSKIKGHGKAQDQAVLVEAQEIAHPEVVAI